MHAFNGASGPESSRFRIGHAAANQCEQKVSKGLYAEFEDRVSSGAMSEVKSRRIHELKLDEEGNVVVAFAKTDAVDEDEDYTYAGAFPAGKNVPISAYSHGSWPQRGGLLPVGRVSLKELGGWAVAEGRFFTDTTGGRDTYLTVKHMGDEQQWSYGYDVVEVADPPSGVKARRGLKLLDPHEISPVLLGAQPLAHTAAIKEATQADLAYLTDDSEDVLPAGKSFAEMSDRLRVDVEAWVKRAEQISELRLKEGRAISSKRMEQLQEFLRTFRESGDALEQLIAGATPAPKEEEESPKARRLRLQAALGAAALEFDPTIH
jgi:hypothetical protein